MDVQTMHIFRQRLFAPTLALVVTLAAIVTVSLLMQRADASRRAQIQLAGLNTHLADLQSAPFNAMPNAAALNGMISLEIRRDEEGIFRGLDARTQVGVPGSLLAAGRADLVALRPVVSAIFVTATEKGGLTAAASRLPALHQRLVARSGALTVVLDGLSRTDAANAARDRLRGTLGAAGVMVLLLAAFAFFYLRSLKARESVESLVRDKEVLLREKEALLSTSRIEATTDALTGLPNRRALEGALAEAPGATERLLVMCDLDGFKQYNDTFGHAAGDALLQRLGDRLADAVSDAGLAYRLGGDEFCVLARCSPDEAERLLNDASSALEEHSEDWRITSSYGAVWIPSEADNYSDGLKLADERMYANKASRSSASREVTDALLQVIAEQNAPLDEHVERVSALCAAVAEALDRPEQEVSLIRLAAQLHDVGKTAIPAAILEKSGPLDEREWAFVHRHPIIGERIVLAAPALASTAPLIRSSHERVDGRGYPDQLAGEEIPLGSRIIAVCDAFDAMTTDRVYRRAMSVPAALAELERSAGSQFDAQIVAVSRGVISRSKQADRVRATSHRHPQPGKRRRSHLA
jgi:diguanylate cyclase (GGDEF)-like protein